MLGRSARRSSRSARRRGHLSKTNACGSSGRLWLARARKLQAALVDDDLIEQLAREAEDGYDVNEMVSRPGTRGRPRLGTAPSTVSPCVSTPNSRRGSHAAAEADGVAVSEVIREALRHHLESS